MNSPSEAPVASEQAPIELVGPTKVTVAAFAAEKNYITADKPPVVKLHLVATLSFADGHTVDTRKMVDIDVSKYLTDFEAEARQLLKRPQASKSDLPF